MELSTALKLHHEMDKVSTKTLERMVQVFESAAAWAKTPEKTQRYVELANKVSAYIANNRSN